MIDDYRSVIDFLLAAAVFIVLVMVVLVLLFIGISLLEETLSGAMPRPKWLRRRPVARYCTECGQRMRRIKALTSRHEYDANTGRRLWHFYWGCDDAFFGYRRRYLDGSPYHDAAHIRTNKVRQRLLDRWEAT